MNEETGVQVVQDLYMAFGRGDLPAILAVLDEEVDWFFNGRSTDILYAGHYYGHEQMMGFFATVATTCNVLAFGPHEILACGEHVVSMGSERVQVKATGCVFETEWLHLFTIRGGKIVRLREYYDTAAMAKAFRQFQQMPHE